MAEREKIKYEDIVKASEGLQTTPIKGKDYVQVNERVRAFRKLYPEGFIDNRMIHDAHSIPDMTTCLFLCEVGYYTEDGKRVVLATGHAFEERNSSYINKTSFIENCETSAVGRALGFLAIGIDTAIASAEELENAIDQQATIEYMNKDEVEAFMKFIVEKGRTVREICNEYKVKKLTDFSKEEAKAVMRKLNKEVSIKIEQDNN